MGTKLWYQGVPIHEHPTLKCYVIYLLKLSMLRVNVIIKVEIP
jgi:hypothetical protein